MVRYVAGAQLRGKRAFLARVSRPLPGVLRASFAAVQDAESVAVIAICLLETRNLAPMFCKLLIKLVAGEGFEPPTLGL